MNSKSKSITGSCNIDKDIYKSIMKVPDSESVSIAVENLLGMRLTPERHKNLIKRIAENPKLLFALRDLFVNDKREHALGVFDFIFEFKDEWNKICYLLK